MKRHPFLILGLLAVSLLGSFVQAQTATRPTPCSATTPTNAICITWGAITAGTNGEVLTGVTYDVEQKVGSGAFASVATGQTAPQFYAKNLAPGTYTFRVYANCTNAGCIKSAASNQDSRDATAPPIQPNTPVIIIAATIREGRPPVYRIIQSVNLRPNEVVMVAPASMRPLFANR